MPNQYDNIDTEYLIQVIKLEMERFDHTNDDVTWLLVYTTRLLIPQIILKQV